MIERPPARPFAALTARMLLAALSAVAVGLGLVGLLGPESRRPWGVIVPAYFYPSGRGEPDWEALAAAAADLPIRVILNPASGPGKAADPRYSAACWRLHGSGARILGYVHTSYGDRDAALVRAEIDAYTRLYDVDGFFIDEMSGDPRSVPYYAGLRDFIKGRDPRHEVVGNPGTYTDEAYRTTPTADVLVLFEGTAASFEEFGPPAWALRYPPGDFAAIVHGAWTAGDMRRVLDHAAHAHLGGLFINDGDGANPYDHLPPYWDRELAALKAPR